MEVENKACNKTSTLATENVLLKKESIFQLTSQNIFWERSVSPQKLDSANSHRNLEHTIT